MAHRVNVTPVHEEIPLSDQEKQQKVHDPVCGQEMLRHDARYMVFRAEEVFYFCSKECQDKFVEPVKLHPQRAA